jgi:KUP system potassium uptake protein
MVAPSSAPTPDAAPKPSSDEAPPQREARGLSLLPLALGAVGVVYGDIGTSPLYSVRECFGEHGVTADPASIYGIMSLVF